MIYSKLYRLGTPDTEWEVAHLFEHLVIKGFYTRCENKKLQTKLITWTGADTFVGVIFIDTIFYTKKLQTEFEDYLTHLPKFSEAAIRYAIATLEAESKVILSANDMSRLRKEVEKLRTTRWNMPIQSSWQENAPAPTLLTQRRSAKDFRDIVIIARLEALSADEQKLFLRAHILLRDIIHDSLGPIAGIYPLGGSYVLRRHDGAMAFMLGFTVSKNTTIRKIQELLAGAALTEVYDLEDIIKSHFKVFADEPIWQSAPVDYFRHTGIITTNQEVASLATANRMQSILGKVTFKVRRMTAEDDIHLT